MSRPAVFRPRIADALDSRERSFACVVCSTLLLALVTATVHAVATTRPSDQPSSRKSLDLSDPKRAFRTAMLAGIDDDAATMTACIYVRNASDLPYVKAANEDFIASHRLAKAAERRFGADAKRLARFHVLSDDNLRQQIADMDAGTIRPGDNGVVFLHTADGRGMKPFKQTPEGWKIDDVSFASDEDRDREEKQLLFETDAVRRLTAQLEEGRFRTTDELLKAYLRERESAWQKARPTTQPAGAPNRHPAAQQ